MNAPNQGLIYGANGYTGQLIARQAAAQGLRPILAGRNEPQLKALGEELGLETRVFSLKEIEPNLKDVGGVLHCAGPFSETAAPMMEACIQAGVHYLDITGEWRVVEQAARLHDRAKNAGIALLPAVGFDVVPSDCLAKQLADALPTGAQLELAFTTVGRSGISPGTARTMLQQLGGSNYVRREGRIEAVSADWKTTSIPFTHGQRDAVTIAWGDIASAFYSTGIPNIEVYTTMPRKQIRRLHRWSWFTPLLQWSVMQWLGRKWIQRNVNGPTEPQRNKASAEFWGRVTDASGKTAEATLRTPEGYTLTTLTALASLQRAVADQAPHGFSTPAMAFGGEFIEQFTGVELTWRTKPASD